MWNGDDLSGTEGWEVVVRRSRHGERAGEAHADVEERAEWIAGAGASLASETVGLDQTDVVREWLRRLMSDGDGQVFVHRRWGTLVAVADGALPLSVIFSDGVDVWSGGPLHAARVEQPLTPTEVEQVMVESLTATERPSWLCWSRL